MGDARKRPRARSMTEPLFASALSTSTRSQEAESEALATLEEGLEGQTPDLLVVFATHHHGAALEELGPRLARATGARFVIGCTAESVIGPDREVEGEAGMSLWAASLPGADVRFFQLSASAGPDGPVFAGSPPVGSLEDSCVLLLADPFTFPADAFLQEFNERFEGVPIMGGMASGAMGPGQSLLFTADGVREAGAVGLVIEGGVDLLPIVSQGCRPVGEPWVITACDGWHIQQLGGRPALEVLTETWQRLDQEDQALLQSAPLIGLAMDARRPHFERGDFIVRSIIGLHSRDRAIKVADFVRRGQTVQLLVRDAESAGEDLQQLLAKRGGPDFASGNGAGALIFSCNGRGTRMFPEPNHDVRCVQAGLHAELPLAGFFAAGEIGPVSGRNYLHGLTASVAVFRARG